MARLRSLSAALTLSLAGSALGQAHEALILVNPNSAESLHVSNFYADARGVPTTGLAYFDPGAADFQEFTATKVPALLGTIANHRNEASIDYIILPSDTPYRMSAANFVTDNCSPVSRFSTTGAYTLARFDDAIIAGVGSLLSNGYYDAGGEARAFDNLFNYSGGEPGSGSTGGKPFIGAALGWTGIRGTSKAEVLSMIDRAVDADGSFPNGTFYFLQTSDTARSGPRHDKYSDAAARINNAGGSAIKTIGPVLPPDGSNVAGAMTGTSNADITGAGFTFVDGAFADHLTSYGATFDNGSQTKVTRWIEKGAVGTFGTIQEPCNYPNKFPTAYLHSMYFDGLTLGEACLRSLSAVPFQGMFIGDPLCRPFAYIPSVGPGNMPTGVVSGNFSFTPTVSTSKPGAAIGVVEVYIDGILRSSNSAGNPQLIRTTFLDDGWHEIRVVAYDNTLVASQGEWVGSITSNNHGKTVSLSGAPTNVNLSGLIGVTPTTNDPNVTEVRLIHNERVVAARNNAGVVTTRGSIVGAGPARLRVEVDFADGSTVRSEPFIVIVNDTNPPAGSSAPFAFSFTKSVKPGEAFVLELPVLNNSALTEPSITVTSGPAQGTILGGTGRYRIIQADTGASGTDSVGFSVTSNSQTDTAIVTLVYEDPDSIPCPADTNVDGMLNGQDFTFWIFAYQSNLVTIADLNMDGVLTPGDFTAWIAAYNLGCDF